jgi:hypothetical protein
MATRRRERDQEERASRPAPVIASPAPIAPRPAPSVLPERRKPNAAERAVLAAQARRERAIAEGRLHVVADIHYGKELSWSECTCGERFESQSQSRVGAMFNAHSRQMNGGRDREWDTEDDVA